MYLLERGPKDLVELTASAPQYLIACKQQLGVKSKTTVQPRCEEQRKSTQSKPDTPQDAIDRYSATVAKGYRHRQSECATKTSAGKDQKGSASVSQSSQKIRLMVAQSSEDGECEGGEI